ncbi:PREDICTED: DNA repair protein RAD51 homolog 4-like [Ceratosolen solmsi marchali]|uniref:DNA repair protein RAD51 homolog 4-like n=1 Tax=Ceratosolen solmsi marchali TaxID=326594 RepID=A0AAJ6VKR4_9HYME|nr:PREDICTED: DNA repair protein RAD51 homolog 4-like [Ceratosolen solmsi marchali]
MNSIDIYHQEKEDVIPTGIEKLDDLLEGGLRYKRIYEICGSSSSGKSQLCHWISLHATINALRVYYIDCSRNFSTSRIQMILESKQCSDIIIGKVMSNIIVHQISTINDLFTIFHNLSKMTNTGENELNKKLVIVDSLSVLCTTVANNELNPILSNFASVSRFFINYFNAIIINVNTIKIVHKGDLFCDKDKHLRADMKPSLGNYWLSIPNIRLLIIAIENTQREISIWNSYQLANGKKCLVDIRDDGIT